LPQKPYEETDEENKENSIRTDRSDKRSPLPHVRKTCPFAEYDDDDDDDL
jgi:hypothetical protein